MNENKEFEVLTSEMLKSMDKKLKEAEKTEKTKLPEKLSEEAVVNLLCSVSAENVRGSSENKKKNKKRVFLRAVSATAAVTVAITSISVIRPWREKTPSIEESVTGISQNRTEDYSQIEEMFAKYSKKYKLNSVKNEIFGSLKGPFSSKATDVADSENMNSSVALPESSDEKNQYGKTNSQVEGVGEADIIKNDGKYLYIAVPDNADWDSFYGELSDICDANTEEETTEKQRNGVKTEKESVFPVLDYNCVIAVIKTDKNGQMTEIARIEIPKAQREDIYYMSIEEMYVENNRLTAILSCQIRGADIIDGYCDCLYGFDNRRMTMAVAYDISDIKNPFEEFRIFQDGSYISSRLIGDELVLLSDYYVDITRDEEDVKETCIPENSCDGKVFSRVELDCICIMDEIYDTSYLVASVMDVKDANTLKTEAVLGAGENVYCTSENLYAVSTDYDGNDKSIGEVFVLPSTEKTQIYKFDIRDYNIKYVKNAVIDGHVLNQFSVDEYNGYLRIATTSGTWGENIVNQVYVLDSQLETAGLLQNIAKGETIKAVRFNGDTAYVVTFEQTDPLFVIDLADAENPKILGELKITGYSAYLHPVGDGLVLGVGLDGTEDGTNDGMKVSLFDVSNPTEPVECGRFTLPGVSTENKRIYFESAAFFNHKSLCWDSENGIMYIPYMRYEERWSYTEGESFEDSAAGILAVKVNEAQRSLSLEGEYSTVSSLKAGAYGSFSRVTYIGDTVFGYSEDFGKICSFDKESKIQLDLLTVGE